MPFQCKYIGQKQRVSVDETQGPSTRAHFAAFNSRSLRMTMVKKRCTCRPLRA